MTHSEAGIQKLSALGATAVQVNAFDAPAVTEALQRSRAEIVIDQLTSLPTHPSAFATAFPGDCRLRLEGGGNLHRAAEDGGVRRYIQQSSGFFLKAGRGLADESEQLALDASPGVAASARMYAELEARVLNSPQMEGIALRYGFFYGPNTWYDPQGGAADEVRRQQVPLVEQGQGVWSFVHVEDAAFATVVALTAEPGTYNIVDNDPSPVSLWLPAFAQWVDAPRPPCLSEQEARAMGGEDAVYYGTRLRGASNGKARKHLHFRPRRLQWLKGDTQTSL
jgi:nucleoside-diphosphate-sugar epimerase